MSINTKGLKQVSFKEVLNSDREVLFWNPCDGLEGEEFWCSVDEFLDLVHSIYTPSGLRDYIKKNKFYVKRRG